VLIVSLAGSILGLGVTIGWRAIVENRKHRPAKHRLS
jgi:hypothetical protein